MGVLKRRALVFRVSIRAVMFGNFHAPQNDECLFFVKALMASMLRFSAAYVAIDPTLYPIYRIAPYIRYSIVYTLYSI